MKWIEEVHLDFLKLGIKIKKGIYRGKSSYQTIKVVDTFSHGKVLLLDGIFMFSEKDEFIYHEMISHVPIFSIKSPKKVLVIGGGDGGTVREILKHPCIEEVDLVEIDKKVVEVSKKYFPALSKSFKDPRCKIHFEDGITFVRNSSKTYDIVIVDSTDPVGIAKGLISTRFYRDVYNILSDEGVISAQTGSIFYDEIQLKKTYKNLGKVFPQVYLYIAPVTVYPGVVWSFCLALKSKKKYKIYKRNFKNTTRYYDYNIHKSAFILPKFIKEMKLPIKNFELKIR